MKGRRLWEIGGFISGAILIVFGAGASYIAQQIAIFGIVVGIALLLTGIGLVILAFAVFAGYGPRTEARAS